MRLFSSPLARASAALLPIIVAVSTLWMLEHAQRPPPVGYALADASATPALDRPQPARADTRLLVLLVDSLARRDVEDPGAMPHLGARLLRGGMHGPVQECADAVTVPCVLAMVHGFDRLSVFALERNFGGSESAVRGTVLGALEQHGVRVGYFGEPQLGKTLAGLSRIDAARRSDEQTLERALAALSTRTLDVLIVHLLALDNGAHLHGADSERYASLRTAVDQQLERALAALDPHDHAVVLGDHGHTLEGRHGTGLDATTYAAYLGPQFRAREPRSMAITDHASIWARLFGLRRAREPSWLRERRPERAADSGAQPAAPAPLEIGARLPPPFALAALAACALVAFGLADLRALRSLDTRDALALVLALAFTLALGLGWPLLRARAVIDGGWFQLAYAALSVLLGSALLGRYPVVPSSRLGRALAGGSLLALPVVQLGGGARVPLLLLGACALVYTRRAAHAAQHRRALGPELLALLALALLAFGLYPIELARDIPQRFPLFAALAERGGTAGCFALLTSASTLGASSERRTAALISSVGGCALALALPSLPARVSMLPCVLALPLAVGALRKRALYGAACFVAPSALTVFFERQPDKLLPVLGVVLMWALTPRLLAHGGALLRGALLLLLVWLGYWTSMGARIGGVDFDFYFAFMQGSSDATSEWPLQAALTAAKHLLPSALGLLFARGAFSAYDFEVAHALGRLRLANLLALAAVVSSARMIPSSWLLGEVMQEGALFVLLLLTLGLVGVWLPSRPAVTAPAGVRTELERV